MTGPVHDYSRLFIELGGLAVGLECAKPYALL